MTVQVGLSLVGAKNNSGCRAMQCVIGATQVRAQETGRITLEDVISVPWIGNPVLSPDGKQFALVRERQIYLLSSDGGWPALLTTTPGGKSEVSWSPDSKNLTFVSQGWKFLSASGRRTPFWTAVRERETRGWLGAGASSTDVSPGHPVEDDLSFFLTFKFLI